MAWSRIKLFPKRKAALLKEIRMLQGDAICYRNCAAAQLRLKGDGCIYKYLFDMSHMLDEKIKAKEKKLKALGYQMGTH
jgi:hypothetical protein